MLRNSPFNRFWVALSVILVSSIVWLIVLYVTFSLSLGESLIYRVMPNSAFSGILAGLLHVWIVFELVFAVHYMLARSLVHWLVPSGRIQKAAGDKGHPKG
jgi:hypothetical protein